jgi:hypothetical protein
LDPNNKKVLELLQLIKDENQSPKEEKGEKMNDKLKINKDGEYYYDLSDDDDEDSYYK